MLCLKNTPPTLAVLLHKMTQLRRQNSSCQSPPNVTLLFWCSRFQWPYLFQVSPTVKSVPLDLWTNSKEFRLFTEIVSITHEIRTISPDSNPPLPCLACEDHCREMSHKLSKLSVCDNLLWVFLSFKAAWRNFVSLKWSNYIIQD
jgi:hypothetical protein